MGFGPRGPTPSLKSGEAVVIMAYGLKRKEPLSFVTNSQSIDSVEKKKREISISFGQLCALWGVIAVMMVIVFFLGVNAGIEKGLKRELEEKENEKISYKINE